MNLRKELCLSKKNMGKTQVIYQFVKFHIFILLIILIISAIYCILVIIDI